MKDRVDEVLKAARRMQMAGDARYEAVDFDDAGLRLKLFAIARLRQLSILDLDKALNEVKEERLKKNIGEAILLQQCHERRDDLRIFYVINTAGRRLTVLAKDASCARYYAHIHGHIQDKANGKVLVMNFENEKELRRSGRALGRALRDGFPGVIKEVGDNVVNELSKKVYTPMTIIE